MNPVKCFYWYHGIYLQIVNIWSWLVCMFVWNTGSLHHWIDVTLYPNPMVWKGNSWDTTSNKLGKNEILFLWNQIWKTHILFSLRLQPYYMTLNWSDIRQIRGPKAGKGSTEEPLAWHHCGGVSYCQGPHEAGWALTKSEFVMSGKGRRISGFPRKENIHTGFPANPVWGFSALTETVPTKRQKWSVQL